MVVFPVFPVVVFAVDLSKVLFDFVRDLDDLLELMVKDDFGSGY